MKMSKNDTQQNPEKLKTKISDEAERKRRENALDEAIENTFPASDPVSAEQPVHAHGFEIPPITFASRLRGLARASDDGLQVRTGPDANRR
jgi:hypothetical protein